MFETVFKKQFVPFMKKEYGIEVDANEYPAANPIEDLYAVYASCDGFKFACTVYYDDLCSDTYLYGELKKKLLDVFHKEEK